jgi:hypothetical protein
MRFETDYRFRITRRSSKSPLLPSSRCVGTGFQARSHGLSPRLHQRVEPSGSLRRRWRAHPSGYDPSAGRSPDSSPVFGPRARRISAIIAATASASSGRCRSTQGVPGIAHQGDDHDLLSRQRREIMASRPFSPRASHRDGDRRRCGARPEGQPLSSAFER